MVRRIRTFSGRRHFPLRLRALVSLGQTLCILSGAFCIMRKFGGLSYDMKQ